jgi:hypothetical protein
MPADHLGELLQLCVPADEARRHDGCPTNCLCSHATRWRKWWPLSQRLSLNEPGSSALSLPGSITWVLHRARSTF